MGVGSEVYGAVKHGRKGLGFELKESYFNQSVMNLADMRQYNKQKTLFDMV